MTLRKRPALRVLWHVAKVAVFVALLVLAVRVLANQSLLAKVEELSPGTVVGFFLCMFGNSIAVALRWTWICTHQLALSEVRWPFLLRLNLFAEFVVIWLPSSLVAEGVRLWRMRKLTSSLQLSAASIVFDRIFGLLALILCVLPFLPAMQGADNLALSPLHLAFVLAALVAAAGAVVMMLRRYRGTVVILQRASEMLSLMRIVSRALVASCMGLVFIVSAHVLVYSELTSLTMYQMVPLILIPQLGRVIPISLFGVSAVEGGTLLLGGALGVDNATLLLVAGLVVLAKYLNSTIGVLWEIGVEGRAGLLEALRWNQQPAAANNTSD